MITIFGTCINREMGLFREPINPETGAFHSKTDQIFFEWLDMVAAVGFLTTGILNACLSRNYIASHILIGVGGACSLVLITNITLLITKFRIYMHGREHAH